MSALKNVTRCLSKLKFRTMKHAPEIFMYAGIAGTVAATVVACKKTEKLPEILDEHKEEVEKLKEVASETPMADYRKEMTKIYATTGLKVARNYALPFAMGVLSVASIMHGHNMLRKWYVETSAALAGMTESYNNLYDNLVKEVGEEKAKEIKAGVVTEQIEETVTDSKGREKKVVKEVKKLGDKGSIYTLKWDQDTADEWVNDFEQNWFTVYRRVEQMKRNLETDRETQHLFWIEAVEYLFGSKGLKLILEDRKAKGLPSPILGGWIYDPDKAVQINVDYIRNPDENDHNSILVTLIPDGNIQELGVGKKGLVAI